MVSRSATITNLVTFAAGSGRTFVDYLAASNSVGRGFFLNGSGDVALEHCRAEGNGRSAYVTGRGASFSGNGSNTVTLADCAFSGNLDKHPRGSGNFDMRGLGLFAANLRSIVIRDSVFERNGVWAGLPSQRAQVSSGTATDCERHLDGGDEAGPRQSRPAGVA